MLWLTCLRFQETSSTKKLEIRMESSCSGGKQLFLDREANAQHSDGWRRTYKSFSLSVADLYDQPLQVNGKNTPIT